MNQIRMLLPLMATLLIVDPDPAHARIEVRGHSLEVVDLHLHTGEVGHQNTEGKAFIMQYLPPFTVPYFPATTTASLSPYQPHLGLRAQTERAGVDHAVLLATYTHHTIGYLTNRALETMLADPRNRTPDGRQWAWGMASINFDDFTDPSLAEARIAALRSYFAQRPDLFIGIKLAHAHQAVTFDDPKSLEVYDVAAELGIPVLLHTGLSPFPNARTEPAYYDPNGLRAIIAAHDGTSGQPRVDFVLAHAGTGDPRAVEHALQLAEEYPNVWLELSALGGSSLVDDDGAPIDSSDPQLPRVIEALKSRGLIDRALYASDGPQAPGTISAYLTNVVDAMEAADYTLDDIRAVLSGNFYRCFPVTDRLDHP